MYRVDGRCGRWRFPTHVAAGEAGCFDSGRDLFREIGPREWYKTRGFRYAAFFSEGCTDSSFRATASRLNAAREQAQATPVKTLHDGARYEAEAIRREINDQIDQTLVAHGFGRDGAATTELAIAAPEDGQLPLAVVGRAADDVAERDRVDIDLLRQNRIDYECPERTVYIHIDDVSVKFQKKGPAAKASPKKRVTNTAVYLEYDGQAYRHCEPDLDSALRFVLGFLLRNQLLHLRLRFFTDGERRLKTRIFEFFSWHPDISLILDWKHAGKKPYDLLSMATYKKHKQPILDHVRQLLWHGQAPAAITYLSGLPADQIRSPAKMNELIGYFERNLPHLPCYSIRRELGLPNSSNRVEKTNDLLIAGRQKKKGMAWTPEGSLALGTLTAVKKNQQVQTWLRSGTVELKIIPLPPKKKAA